MAKAAPTLVEAATRNLLAAFAAEGKSGFAAQFKCAKLAADAVATIACLAICAHFRQEDGWPTQQEYADWWKINVRHAQRRWVLVKQAFPGEAGPDRLARALVVEYKTKFAKRETAFALSVPATGEFAPLLTAA